MALNKYADFNRQRHVKNHFDAQKLKLEIFVKLNFNSWIMKIGVYKQDSFISSHSKCAQ